MKSPDSPDFLATLVRLATYQRRDVDLEEGEALALTVECPTCSASPAVACTPYTHWVRVRDALRALPRPVQQHV